MATNFPGSQDSFTNPTSSDTLDSPDHAAQHTNVNDAVEAIELALLDGAPLYIDDTNERVGIGTTSPGYKLTVLGTGYVTGDFTVDQFNPSDAVFHVDTTDNRVGIGKTSPACLLHIYEGASGVTSQNGAADLIIESDDQAGIALNTPNTGTGYLRFVDPDNNAQGGLSYAHSTDKLSLRTSGSDKVVIDSSGFVQIQDGSSSAPSLVFVSDTNTGFYRYGENDLGISVGGVASRWNQSGIYLASGDWFRSQGSAGWFNQTYSGGWNMTDSTYVRIYNTKSLYLSNEIFVPNMDGTSSYNTVRFNSSTGQLMRFTSITEIKEDITSIKPMMEYLNERSYLYDLRPVLYHEKDKADGTNNTRREYISGFVAEEVLDVAPELAYYDINGELQSYSNDGLIPHIVAELQRLMPMVEELYGDANPDWVAPVARPDDRKTAERELYNEASAAQALIGDPNADPFDGQRHLEDFEEQ